MRTGVFLLLLCACGDVNKAPPDARPQDAFEADSPLACAAGEMACAGACQNVMSSVAHCGSCTTTCSPAEYCGSGTCKRLTSCADYKAADPMAPNGIYDNTNDPKHLELYCDFAAGQQYEFRWHDFTLVPDTGFAIMRMADYQDTATQAAFIAVYNKVGGVRPHAVWSSNNCCITVAAGLRLTIGGTIQFPYGGGAQTCNPTGGYTLPAYQFGSATNTSLPANYFQTNAVGEAAGCGDGNNPAIWMRKTAI